MNLLLYALWKAPVIEQVTVEQSKRRCTTCGGRKATIKLKLPHVREGTIYQYVWTCGKCYARDYAKSKEKFPDAIEIPESRKLWKVRRVVIVETLFPRKGKERKDQTPNEILQDIVARQPPHEEVERASHLLHLQNVIKMLTKYGEDDLVSPFKND